MIGARVNGRLVTIDYEIQNGDRIEIITSANSKGPSRDWLKIVKSTQAKSKISQWFKAELKEDNILRGKSLLLASAKAKGVNLADYLKPEYQEVCMRKYGFRDWDSLLAAVGHGSLKEGQVVNRLQEEWNKTQKKNMTPEKAIEEVLSASRNQSPKQKGGILVKGVDDLAVHFSKCCAPVPGDEIVGFVTRGRGISIHRTDCVNMVHLPQADKVRLIEAEWSIGEEEKTERLYNAEIKIFAKNNPGVLLEVTRILSEDKVNINSIIARAGKNNISTIVVSFEIRGTSQLTTIVNRLRQIENVVDIERTTG